MKFHLNQGRHTATALGLILAMSALPAFAQSATGDDAEKKKTAEQTGETVLDQIVVLSASEQLRQAPGVSNISAEEIARRPPANDLSEIIRRMPGVNLTGNSSTGMRGNNRQIDIRGMGPENTLILIDGKPVLARNAVRMSIRGERDTRGDSNWVPAELVERIEVIRGPAAARYGSGAAGGVVNIITKRPETTTYSFGTYLMAPQDSREGGSRRINLMVGGPVNDFISYRLSGGVSRTDPDKADINGPLNADGSTSKGAGREGVVNRDVKGLLSIEPSADHRFDLEASWSRQSNRYAGDSLFGSGSSAGLINLWGQETNRVVRTTFAATHYGTWDFGDSTSFIQWERSRDYRAGEGVAGAVEGAIELPIRFASRRLDNVVAKSEFNIPLSVIFEQKLTAGAEYRGEFMTDDSPNGTLTGTGTSSSQNAFSFYLEDNIHVTDKLLLTPGLRADYQSEYGINLSPSLNASYNITDDVTLKAGIARAYKTPNLYQLNGDYFYNSRGRGCWVPSGGVNPCYIVGNPDLEPETSINSEIGLNYTNDAGWNMGATWFHNDYDNKVGAGRDIVGRYNNANLFRWENMGPATVSGIEGNIIIPILDNLTWNTNFTKMLKSVDGEGQPLSLIPDYTINASLEWQATERLGFTLSATHYGAISPRTVNIYTGTAITGTALVEREAYTLANISLDFAINENFSLKAGVNNVFDKQLLRTDGETGANTFNEPGRSFFVGLNGKF